MRSLLSITVLFLFGGLLAGCIGGDDSLEVGKDDEEPIEGTGRVTGQILTTDLKPVTGARVVLSDGMDLVAETTTDNDGTYRMDNIEPGDYRLQVTATCCRENARAISVKADGTTPVDLQLEPFTQADLQAPFVEEYQWSGMLACGFASPYLSGDACSDLDDEAEGNHPFELDVGIKSVYGVLVWEPTGGLLGDELQFGLAQQPCNNEAICSVPTDFYGNIAGESPLYLRIDGGGPQSFEGIEEPEPVQWRVWPRFGAPDIYYQQKFTIYYTLHYHQEAPEDHDPLPDL